MDPSRISAGFTQALSLLAASSQQKRWGINSSQPCSLSEYRSFTALATFGKDLLQLAART